MPRMGRIVLPNYPHHVVQRGQNRQVEAWAVDRSESFLGRSLTHCTATNKTAWKRPTKERVRK